MRESFNEKDNPRVNYIITKGGEMVNSIPDFVQVMVNIRANNLDAMEVIEKRVIYAFKVSADVIGARMEYKTETGVMPLVTDDTLYELYSKNAK